MEEEGSLKKGDFPFALLSDLSLLLIVTVVHTLLPTLVYSDRLVNKKPRIANRTI